MLQEVLLLFVGALLLVCVVPPILPVSCRWEENDGGIAVFKWDSVETASAPSSFMELPPGERGTCRTSLRGETGVVQVECLR